MDKQLFRALLDEIAQEEIPETMTLWPKIERQLNLPLTRRATLSLRGARLVAAVVLTLIAATAAYAIYQDLIGDAGLQTVSQENLVVHFDRVQQIDRNVAVTLQYGYADANRIVIAYDAEGTALPEENVNSFMLQSATLTDDQGHQFTSLNGSGGGGGGGGGGSSGGMSSFSSGQQDHYDASIIEDRPKALRLHLNLTYALAYTDKPEKQLQTSFDFTLPFNPGVVVEPEQTVNANGSTMTLRKMVIAPSLTRIELCYNAPAPDASGRVWAAYGELAVDGKVIVAESQLTDQPVEPAPGAVPCHWLNLPESLHHQHGTWTLTITALRQLGSEDQAAVARILKDQYQILVTPMPDGGYSYDTPPEATREAVAQTLDQVILENLKTQRGPWVFEVKVP